MKFSSASIAPFFLALGTALPAAEKAEVGKDAWKILGLEASAEPHGSITHFGFDIEIGAEVFTCSATGESYQTLGVLPRTHCADSPVDFAWESRPVGGALLTVWLEVSAGSWSHATHDIHADLITWANEQVPTGKIQVYSGPKDLTLDVVVLGE
ncbi:hypothetical protein F5B20DRAFT_567111 [Whalleya microplaca]|nr:hypothetical protein F5B20DRAFT_567111 [Whalleya microplaca]